MISFLISAGGWGKVMQEFIYHMVPADMRGDKLISLNSLETAHPELYEKYSKKYFDHPERLKLLRRQIPKLNCLWNDVIHFSPLHPYHVYNALTELGIQIKEELKFYRVPIQNLKNNKNAIYMYSKETYRGPNNDIDEDDINFININDYKEMKEIPSVTVEYYKDEKEKGNKFGLFAFIPHLLTYGEVDIKDAEIITWNNL